MVPGVRAEPTPDEQRRRHGGLEHQDDRELAGDDGSHDQRRARAALERGEVLPLTGILRRSEALLDGRMIEAELEREDGRWVYEITLLDADGFIVEALFDARTAELLELEGRRLERLLQPRAQGEDR